MARVSEIMIRQLPEQRMLTIRKTIDFYTEYADFMGGAVSDILSVIERSGTFPGSSPIVCFHNMELEACDVEISFQVSQPIEAEGDIIAQTLPSRTVAITIDRGQYENQDPTLEELMAWIPEHGLEADGGIYYHYLNGEEQPQGEYLTEMFIPVKRAR